MSRRKFFILDYTLGDDHIQNILCRVVGDKYDPKASYAPEGALVREHFPNILPKPNITANRRECFEKAASSGAKLKLAKLFHLGVDCSHEERTEMESELVKRYSLDSGPAKFKKLMEDPRYAAEVREVLARKRSKKAYLVEGFMTTTNATWSRTVARIARNGAGAAATGGPAAVLEAAADATHNNRTTNASGWITPGEEIFAVSYLEVKLEGKGFLGIGRKDPVIRDTVVASNKTAALNPRNARHGVEEDDSEGDSDVVNGSNSSSSDSEEEDEDEDTEVVLSTEEEGVIEGLDAFLELDLTFE
jgi:hypothetical protein